MGVAAERELGMGMGQNLATPRRGVVLHHHHVGRTPHAIERVGDIASLGKMAAVAIVLHAGDDERVGAPTDGGVAIEQHLPPHLLLAVDEFHELRELGLERHPQIIGIIVVAENGIDTVGSMQTGENRA